MNSKILTLLLVLSFPTSAAIGGVSIYLLNEIVQTANSTTYSAEEEMYLLDLMIEKARKNEIDSVDLVRILESQKKNRNASYDLVNSIQGMSNSVIVALVFVVIGQLSLLSLFIKKRNELPNSPYKKMQSDPAKAGPLI
jgi:hypothetical protein